MVGTYITCTYRIAGTSFPKRKHLISNSPEVPSKKMKDVINLHENDGLITPHSKGLTRTIFLNFQYTYLCLVHTLPPLYFQNILTKSQSTEEYKELSKIDLDDYNEQVFFDEDYESDNESEESKDHLKNLEKMFQEDVYKGNFILYSGCNNNLVGSCFAVFGEKSKIWHCVLARIPAATTFNRRTKIELMYFEADRKTVYYHLDPKIYREEIGTLMGPIYVTYYVLILQVLVFKVLIL